MNENLKKALELMLFMSDQQILDIEQIDFKKANWYHKYTWTPKREEKFISYLSDNLKKDWEGIAISKPKTKKERDSVAKEFNFNYGCKIRPLNIDDFTDLVPWGQIEEQMTKEQVKRFTDWMFGQTSSPHGVYRWDLERWLRYAQDDYEIKK